MKRKYPLHITKWLDKTIKYYYKIRMKEDERFKKSSDKEKAAELMLDIDWEAYPYLYGDNDELLYYIIGFLNKRK